MDIDLREEPLAYATDRRMDELVALPRVLRTTTRYR
jgi:hypothetical protein